MPATALPGEGFLPIPAEELAALRTRYPAGFDSSLVLPCLRRIQEIRGYVADGDIGPLARYLGVPRIQVEEVLSYYSQYHRAPIGRWHLQICHNVSCSMRGAERVIAACKSKLGVEVGGTTPDGRFTLSTVECLGSCGSAPAMMVNDAYRENVSVESLDKLLSELE